MIKLIDENQYYRGHTPRAIVRDFSKFGYLHNLLNLFGSMEIHIPYKWVDFYMRTEVFK